MAASFYPGHVSVLQGLRRCIYGHIDEVDHELRSGVRHCEAVLADLLDLDT